MAPTTIHDWPPELLSLMFRLGSEDVSFNLMRKNRQESFPMPKRFPEDRHYVIKLFARLASEVCSSWRKLVLSDKYLRLVIIGAPGSIKRLHGDAYNLNGWQRILDDTAPCDVQLRASVTATLVPDLNDILTFLGDNAARMSYLLLELHAQRDFSCACRLFNNTAIKFPRLQHLDIVLGPRTGKQVYEHEHQTCALDTSRFPSLRHLFVRDPYACFNSFLPYHPTISSLQSLELRLFHGRPDQITRQFPKGLANVLRANTKLQVLSLDGEQPIYQKWTHVGDPDGVIELGSLKELNLCLTVEGARQFLMICSFPVLKTLMLTVSTGKFDGPLESVHFPSLGTLVFTPGKNDQATILSYLHTPELVSFTYHSGDDELCSFSMTAPRLQQLELSGGTAFLNSCLRSLKQSIPLSITTATIGMRNETTGLVLMADVDPSLFGHVQMLRVSCNGSPPVLDRLYSCVASLEKLELCALFGHTDSLLPPVIEGEHLFLPKLETIRCLKSRRYPSVLPLSDQHCSRLIALAERQAKYGRRLKSIYLVSQLTPGSRLILEGVVDKVVAGSACLEHSLPWDIPATSGVGGSDRDRERARQRSFLAFHRQYKAMLSDLRSQSDGSVQ